MKLVWTSSQMIGPRMIQWGLNEDVSHFAVIFDDTLVMHSSVFGVEVLWIDKFLKKRKIVYETRLDMDSSQEDVVFKAFVRTFSNRAYDWKALAYFIWRGVLFKAFNVALPKKSEFKSRSGLLCTELASELPNWLLDKSALDLAIITPMNLYKMVQARLSEREYHAR